MVMSPLELHNKEFKRALRGYKEEEVDGFLALIMRDYEELYKENLNLKEQLENQEGNIHHYKQMEDTLKETLVVAQKTAQEVKEAAANEAESLRTLAHKDAAALIKEAELKAEAIVHQAKKQGEEIMRQFEELQKQSQVFKVNFRSMLLAQLDLMGNKDAEQKQEIC